MDQPLVGVAALLGLLVLAVPVTRWFGRTVQRAVMLFTGSATAALYVYHALVLPGTALHELSHVLCAWLLRVPVGRLTLFPVIEGPGTARFGSVQIAQVDPWRESLIGLAPLVTGVAAVIAIASRSLGVSPPHALWLSPAAVAGSLAQTPDSFFWVYLLAAIGNTMLPSASDRRAWLALLMVAAALVGALLLLGAGVITSMAVAWSWRVAGYLAGAVGLTLLIDLVLGALIHVTMLPFHRAV
ncbi:MAG: hypothetical protein ACYCYF_08515 [Anaerolineae bacterium]